MLEMSALAGMLVLLSGLIVWLADGWSIVEEGADWGGADWAGAMAGGGLFIDEAEVSIG